MSPVGTVASEKLHALKVIMVVCGELVALLFCPRIFSLMASYVYKDTGHYLASVIHSLSLVRKICPFLGF